MTYYFLCMAILTGIMAIRVKSHRWVFSYAITCYIYASLLLARLT